MPLSRDDNTGGAAQPMWPANQELVEDPGQEVDVAAASMAKTCSAAPRVQRRVAQQVGHDPVLQQGQCPTGLPGREEVTARPPGVAGGLEPFSRPQLERLLAAPVPGPQLSAQHLAHQMVVPEAGPLIIQGDQEQVGRVDAAQQRRGVLPGGDGRARACGQLLQTDVSSMNRTTSGGSCSRTSEMKYSAIACCGPPAPPQSAPGPWCRAATAPPSAAPRPIPRFADEAAPGQPGRPGRRSSPADRRFRPGKNAGHGRGARTAHPTSAAGAAAAVVLPATTCLLRSTPPRR
jgi:hypothetical protein